jgi:hypothetical protein
LLGLGFLGFRVLGFRVLKFRILGFRVKTEERKNTVSDSRDFRVRVLWV